MLPVTSLLACALAAAFMAYSSRIIRRRRQAKVALLDGGDVPLARLIRAQGNLAEYGLLLLALIGLSEANGAPWWWLAILAALFLAGRASHGYGLIVAEADEGRGSPRFRWRVMGMATTFAVIWLSLATLLATLAARLLPW